MIPHDPNTEVILTELERAAIRFTDAVRASAYDESVGGPKNPPELVRARENLVAVANAGRP